jgi:hypothetical protein
MVCEIFLSTFFSFYSITVFSQQKIIVAQDGAGKYNSVQAAFDAIPFK